MWLVGFKGEPVKDLVLRLSSYHVPDVLNSTYADASWVTKLSGGQQLRLGAQTIYQSSTGSNSIGDFSVGYGGVKADLSSGGLTGTLGYTQTGRNSNLRSPYSSWAGYTSMLIKDFYAAGQKAFLIGAAYDFKAAGLPGLTLGANIATGRDAINPTTGAAVANATEYDIDLNYRFTDTSWPKWVQPLWIRVRAGVLVPTSGGNTENYRISAKNLLLSEAGQYAAVLTGSGQYTIDQVTIANYWDLDIRQEPAFLLSNRFADINGATQVRPIESSSFRNGIVYGNNGNEFKLDVDESANPLFTFEHFLVRTDQPTNAPVHFPVQSTIYRNLDPGFRDGPEGDLRLRSNALAKGKADPAPTVLLDIEGQQRPNFGDASDGFLPDLGCYEYYD